MRVRLVTVSNEYVATVRIQAVLPPDILFHQPTIRHYVPTGIEWFDRRGCCPVYREAQAALIADADMEIEDLDEVSAGEALLAL